MMSVCTGAQLERSGKRLQVGKWKVYVELIRASGMYLENQDLGQCGGFKIHKEPNKPLTFGYFKVNF